MKKWKSVSKFLGTYIFLVLFLLKEAFPNAAFAFTSLNACARSKECLELIKGSTSSAEDNYKRAAAMEDKAAVDPNVGYEQDRLIMEADADLAQLKNELGKLGGRVCHNMSSNYLTTAHNPKSMKC